MIETIERLDLNHLRVFEKVASTAGFSAAARTLRMPKSNVSRSVASLEATLGTRLFQRTTRNVVLTAAGEALRERCIPLLADIGEALEYVSGLADSPRGHIKVSAGIGFGINVLSEALPQFLQLYPDVRVTLSLSTRLADLVAEGVDCAVRLGALPDSSLVSTQLGSMNRYVCAAPGYLALRGTPTSFPELSLHDTIEMPGADGRSLAWTFVQDAASVRVDPQPRLLVDEALTIVRLIQNGAGIGIISSYLCGPDILAGRLVRLFPEWCCPPLPVNLVYPSRRELAPAVRAFAAFLKGTGLTTPKWQSDVLADAVKPRQGSL